MAEGLEHIGKKSVIWSYVSVFFSVGAGVILLPFILHFLNSETVAIWNVLQTIYILVVLMDFGFRPSFARNLSYIFSGVKEFQVEGVSHVQDQTCVDYRLLKGTIHAMKIFYRWVAFGILLLLLTLGTAYFMCLLQKYHGNRSDAIIAWGLFCIINCYNLYTLYYDSLLTGKGYIERMQQITILGQCIYMAVAICLLYLGYGLVSVVSAQVLSIVVKRVLSYKVFYTKEIREKLSESSEDNPKEILRIMMPNALKVGLTQLGGFAVNKSSLFLGSLYLSLNEIAMYGISIQILDIIARCGTMLYMTYTPRLAQCRAENDMKQLKRMYILCVISLVTVYVLGGASLIAVGNTILDIIGSHTHLLPFAVLLLLLIVSLLEQNHAMAAGFIQADNKIPFFIPSLLSGAATIFMIWLLVGRLGYGIVGLILAPGIVQLAYQNWKWPSMLIREFRQSR